MSPTSNFRISKPQLLQPRQRTVRKQFIFRLKIVRQGLDEWEPGTSLRMADVDVIVG